MVDQTAGNSRYVQKRADETVPRHNDRGRRILANRERYWTRILVTVPLSGRRKGCREIVRVSASMPMLISVSSY